MKNRPYCIIIMDGYGINAEVNGNAVKIADAKVIEKLMKITGQSRKEVIENIEEARTRTGCAEKEYLIYRFYELTKEETDLLNKQGYVLLDNNEFCLVEVEKNQYVLFKVFDEYKSITLSLK